MLWILFEKFFKIGLFSFGGGYAMLPLFKREFIQAGIITEEIFYEIITLSEMTPGSFAVNAATFIGKEKMGMLGAFVSTFAVCLPSVLLLILLMNVIKKYDKSPVKEKIFKALRPAVFGFILSAIAMLFKPAMVDWTSVILYLASMGLIYSKKVHPILVIFIMGFVRMIL